VIKVIVVRGSLLGQNTLESLNEPSVNSI